MKTLIILLFAVMLSGCFDNNNHGYGYHFDFITPLGIEYRNDNDYSGFNSFELDQIYTEVQECSQMFYNPSGLMVISNDSLDILGRYYENPDLIVIKAKKGIKHEILHYLLDKTRGHTSNNDHNMPIFTDCAESPLDLFDWLESIIDNIEI